MNQLKRVLLSFVVSAAPVAHADHGPTSWALDTVVHGDGVVRGTAVTVDEVIIEDTTGLVRLTVCCGLEDLATCTSTRTYEIGWTLGAPYTVLRAGDTVDVTLSNAFVSGADCADIDPFVIVGDDNGNPADSLPGLGVPIVGPNNLFNSNGGGRFLTDATNANHDPSVRTLTVTDYAPHDGYFHIDIAQRWGLQYEVTWVYRWQDEAEGESDGESEGTTDGDGSDDDSDGGDDNPPASCASTASTVGVLAAIVCLFAVIPRRRRFDR